MLIRGLADSKIKLDLLGDKNQGMSLEAVLQFVEAEEARKRSVWHLQQSQKLDAARSLYRRTKQDEIKDRWKTGSCNYYGKQGYGKNAPSRVRKSVCPAYCTTCAHFKWANHYEAICRGKGRAPSQHDEPPKSATSEVEGATMQFFTTTSVTARFNSYPKLSPFSPSLPRSTQMIMHP